MEFLYITNRPEIALIAEKAGVERIFVDMEVLGKAERQSNMDTVKNSHTIEDVKRLRSCLRKSQLMVRVNSIYSGSAAEIDAVIEAGADQIMLPYFKTAEEVGTFLDAVNGRARTVLLFETPASIENIDEILELPGIDDCMIGLNDLHLGYGDRFLFEPLANGIVEYACGKFRKAGKTYGFGGIAKLGQGLLDARLVLSEHVRLQSSMVILARAFCDTQKITDLREIERIFTTGVAEIRAEEERLKNSSSEELLKNQQKLKDIVSEIARSKG